MPKIKMNEVNVSLGMLLKEITEQIKGFNQGWCININDRTYFAATVSCYNALSEYKKVNTEKKVKKNGQK